MKTILIAGTHAWDGDNDVDWYCPTSNFEKFLREQGVDVFFAPGPRPFIWSTEVGGIGFGNRDLLGWAAAGYALQNFAVPPLCPERAPEVALIAHSHGLQVALYACRYGLKVKSLISLGSPIRKDMQETAQLARPNIGHWTHVHSDSSDRMQWFGELFDGHWGIVRKSPLADVNESIPKVGHSELLRDPQQYHYWVERGWIERLK